VARRGRRRWGWDWCGALVWLALLAWAVFGWGEVVDFVRLWWGFLKAGVEAELGRGCWGRRERRRVVELGREEGRERMEGVGGREVG